MPLSLARAAVLSNHVEGSLLTRAWRPFPPELADLLCVEEDSATFAARIHDRYSVTVVRSAAVVRCEASRSLVAAPNSVLLVPALQLYSLRAQGRVTGAVVTMLIGASQLPRLIATDRAALVTDVGLVNEVEALVGQLSRDVKSTEWATTLRALIERLTSRGGAVPFHTQGASLGRVRDYLRDNPTMSVTIADLAEMAGLTESHFIRAFHREFGLPPHAYHLRRKLAAASELLVSGVPVSTVAYECGFADQSHLSRKFKEVYGLTPAAWATALAFDNGRKGTAKIASIQHRARVARVMS